MHPRRSTSRSTDEPARRLHRGPCDRGRAVLDSSPSAARDERVDDGRERLALVLLQEMTRAGDGRVRLPCAPWNLGAQDLVCAARDGIRIGGTALGTVCAIAAAPSRRRGLAPMRGRRDAWARAAGTVARPPGTIRPERTRSGTSKRRAFAWAARRSVEANECDRRGRPPRLDRRQRRDRDRRAYSRTKGLRALAEAHLRAARTRGASDEARRRMGAADRRAGSPAWPGATRKGGLSCGKKTRAPPRQTGRPRKLGSGRRPRPMAKNTDPGDPRKPSRDRRDSLALIKALNRDAAPLLNNCALADVPPT